VASPEPSTANLSVRESSSRITARRASGLTFEKNDLAPQK